jgi:hypothetical protein
MIDFEQVCAGMQWHLYVWVRALLSCTASPLPYHCVQLKIENSTLNEKIEDRNEELARLRKKTTTAVQVGG